MDNKCAQVYERMFVNLSMKYSLTHAITLNNILEQSLGMSAYDRKKEYYKIIYTLKFTNVCP